MAGNINETIAHIAGAPPSADGLQFARFVSVAAATLYLYDIFLTLDMEVALIWSRINFNLLNILYITNRYICYVFFIIIMHNLPGFHWELSDTYCKIPWDLIGIFIAYTAWTGIMTVRVCAIYRQKWRLVIFTRFLWAGAMGALFATLFMTYKESAPMAYDPLNRICLITANSNTMKAIPIGPAVYEIILIILTIFKSFDFSDDASDTTLPYVYRVLAREGVAYFIISMMITLVNMISWYLFPGSPVFLLLFFYWGIMSPLMARLVLNLKSAHQVNLSEQSGTGDVTASVPYFRPGQRGYGGAHPHTNTYTQTQTHTYAGAGYGGGYGGYGAYGRSARDSTAKNSLVEHPIGSSTRVAVAAHSEEEEEVHGWNAPAFHVLRTMSAIPLKNLELDHRRLSS